MSLAYSCTDYILSDKFTVCSESLPSIITMSTLHEGSTTKILMGHISVGCVPTGTCKVQSVNGLIALSHAPTLSVEETCI